MKKHDEGYALVLVLVVMVVLGIAASALMSVGLRNLKAQQAVGERMVDKYAAQGEIEKVIALVSQPYEAEKEVQTDAEGSGEDAKKALENRLTAYVSEWVKENSGAEPGEFQLNPTATETKYEYTCTIEVKAQKDNMSIDCKLQLTGSVEEEANAQGKRTCRITPEEPVYKSYVISHTTEGGGS